MTKNARFRALKSIFEFNVFIAYLDMFQRFKKATPYRCAWKLRLTPPSVRCVGAFKWAEGVSQSPALDSLKRLLLTSLKLMSVGGRPFQMILLSCIFWGSLWDILCFFDATTYVYLASYSQRLWPISLGNWEMRTNESKIKNIQKNWFENSF